MVMLSLVTVSPVITAFHSCYLSHHIFDQVNLWGYGYKTQHPYLKSRLNPLKKARGEIWPKRSEEKKTYQDEDKKSAINKKINSQIKKPHLKIIPIKDNGW